MRQHSLIVSKADDMQPLSRRDVAADHILDMAPRIGLLSEQMQCKTDHAIAQQNIPAIGRSRGSLLELPCKGQNLAQVSVAQASDPQSRNGAQLMVGIVQLF